MNRPKATVEVIPSAKRLIRSLRDVGYDFKQAVADLVDNSIGAGASVVEIDMRFDGEDSYLRIADNGSGMRGTTINEAMRFGTERDYDADELGKFGLGLKTASLSQCSQLTVASRTDRNSRRIEARQWDLGHVDRTNRWEIIDVPADERSDVLTEPLARSTGTVVVWQKLDRVLGYKVPWGERARNGFLRLAEELDLHLGMVFHRFLAGKARRRRKLKITLNGTVIEPWDPYATEESHTVELPKMEFEINGDHGVGLVGYAPFILPSRERFSSERAFARYAGPGKWNYQQGFYIYRSDRMIQSGGWSYMRTSDEHTKLARVALDFHPDLDSAFDINVAKARVNLPADLKAQLKPHVERLAKQARKEYSPGSAAGRGGQLRGGSGDERLGPVAGRLAQSAVEGAARGLADCGPRSGNGLGRIGEALEAAASKARQGEALKKVRKALTTHDPVTASEIGWTRDD